MQELVKWKLLDFEKIILECQDIIAEVAITIKAEMNYDYYLLSSYAKAILNIREVLCLLHNGFPDGALSRARNIYEQMIIMHFISRHKDEKDGYDLIDRYFDNQDIQSHYNNKLYYEELINFNEESLSDICNMEINRHNMSIKEFQNKYPDCKRFNDYWWASKIINQPSFEKLQKVCNAGLFRVIYRRACISTHASAMGDFALLGRDNPDGNILTTQETYEGFEMPICLSMDSFGIMTDIVFANFSLENTYTESLELICTEYRKHVFE